MAANPEKLKSVKDLGRPDIVFALARGAAAGKLVFGGSDGKVWSVDFAAPKLEPQEIGRHESYVTGVAVVGKTVVSGGYDCKLSWWDLEARKEIRSVAAHAKWIRAVEASPDGKVVASVADDMVCRLWEAGSGKPIGELRGHQEKTPNHFPSMLFACAFSPDGKRIATADKVGHVVVWDVATGKSLTTLEAPGMYTWDPVHRKHSIGGVRSVAFSPDGSLLAVGGISKIGNIDHLEGKARVEVFDWAKGERKHELVNDKFQGLVERLLFHPQGDWLLAVGGNQDGFLWFVDLKAKKTLRDEKVGLHVHGVVFGDGPETLYAAGHQKLQAFELKG
jgi:WD40 repeat protein